MLVETVVLGGQHGLDEMPRHCGERNGMPELVGAPAEPRERLGLELDLLQRLAGGRAELADPASVDEETDRHGGPPRSRIVARPEVERPRRRPRGETDPARRGGPGSRGSQAGGARPRRRRPRPRPLAEDLARRVDERGLLQPRQIDARRRAPRPDPERRGAAPGRRRSGGSPGARDGAGRPRRAPLRRSRRRAEAGSDATSGTSPSNGRAARPVGGGPPDHLSPRTRARCRQSVRRSRRTACSHYRVELTRRQPPR